MSSDLPAALLREGLVLLVSVGGPLFAVLLVVGLAVGILQAATQVNDAAVGFLPRALAAGFFCWLAGRWMLERMATFLGHAITRMAG